MSEATEERNAQANGQAQLKTPTSFPVVGLGASAGGLQALKQFFEGMPAESGMAFVVIMHLSPQHESHAAAILQNTTQMPVMQVTEAVKVEPNRVYVIPPSKHLAMEDGHINVSEPSREMGRQVAVDLFFRTLADTHQTNAICIVLSGTGADGSVGIKRVKEAGGIAMAQDPRDAEYDAMPRNAINTGMIDFVLPVVEMPEKLVELWRNARQIQLPVEADAPVVAESQTTEHALRDVLATLRKRTGHDFTHYKRATVLRRIERRMQVNTVADLPAYRDLLRDTPAEAQLLLKDLLIGVTNFFRDRVAFETFEREVVPLLFEGKAAGDVVRVWCAGCATGEEAYSVAMLLLEHAARMAHPPAIQIFATDIDEAAIATARGGSYPEAIEADVAPTRLRQFFTQELGGYRVNKEVRECVLFAMHNLIKDPPFSKLDAVTCRNLLIYLNREVQEQVFELFHFALLRGGFVFLGASESLDGAADLFTSVNKKHRLFRANPVTRHARGLPTLPLDAPTRRTRAGSAGVYPDDATERRRIAFGELHQQLVEQYAPPSVVVNADYEIVHLSENAGQFLRRAGGEPSSNLVKEVLPELRLELRTALFQAMQTGRSTEARRVKVERDRRVVYVNMIVRPTRAAEGAALYALVLFIETEETTGEEGKESPGGEADAAVRGLEEEAQGLREQLRATAEQYETTVEELKSANEEMQSVNEELRSTGEELETSKEELQSINEELRTGNQELKNKVEEVSETNADLKNLMASTDIGTIFLDRALRIKRYTPRATDLFNIIPSDIGRPLEHITHKLEADHLATDAAEVLRTLHLKEREMRGGTSDHRYLVRIAPYRTLEDKIDGVVLSFQDITEFKRANDRLQESSDRLRESEEQLRRHGAELEQRVAERTAELSATNDVLQTEIGERQQAQAARSLLLRRFVGVQEEERRRLSRELHDQFGQQLAALNLNLDLLKAGSDEPEKLRERIDVLNAIVKQLDADVDFLAWELRPTALDDLGLIVALDNFINEWAKHNNVPVQFHRADTDERFAPEIEITLYRIVQEALSNVSKHAQAQTVSVILERRKGTLSLIVEDDGRGFDPAELETTDGKKLGLTGMRERAALLGGTVDIESHVGNGTTVFVRIPVTPEGGGANSIPVRNDERR